MIALFYVLQLGFEVLKNRAIVQLVELHLAQQPSKLQLAFLQGKPGGLRVRIHGLEGLGGLAKANLFYFRDPDRSNKNFLICETK